MSKNKQTATLEPNPRDPMDLLGVQVDIGDEDGMWVVTKYSTKNKLYFMEQHLADGVDYSMWRGLDWLELNILYRYPRS